MGLVVCSQYDFFGASVSVWMWLDGVVCHNRGIKGVLISRCSKGEVMIECTSACELLTGAVVVLFSHW